MPLRNGLDFCALPNSNNNEHPPQKSSKNCSLRIVTYNMASGNVGPYWKFAKNSGGDQHELRRQLIETILLESEADVVCVQESIIKSSEWSGRSDNLNHARTISGAINKLRQEKQQQNNHSKLSSSKAAAAAASSQHNENNSHIDSSHSYPTFVRSTHFALTHCGQTFLYYNKNTCKLLHEGVVNGGQRCPSFPVIAIEKKKEGQSETQKNNENRRDIYLICSIHLAPFPQQFRMRQSQFSLILSELDRLERVWKLSKTNSTTKNYYDQSKTESSPKKKPNSKNFMFINVDDEDESSSDSHHQEVKIIEHTTTTRQESEHETQQIVKVHKIIAGDSNMTNEQFPSPESCRRVIDCWYDFKFQTQYPPASAFREKVEWFDKSNVNFAEYPKFFEDAYTFGGDNDYNQGGTIELRRFQLGKGPYCMRYDRVFAVLDQQNLPNQTSCSLKVSHMQRMFDQRIVIKSGHGCEDVDAPQKKSSIGSGKNAVEISDLPGRYLSDHFGLLVDFEVKE